MKSVHCAAVDLGATSGRIIVGTWRQDQLTLDEVHRFPNQFRALGTHHYWEITALWAEISAGLREAKRRFPSLAAVGVDSWGVDHVLVDAAGRPVFPVHAYRDDRTQSGMKRLAARGLARIYAATGIPNIFYNSSLQLEETIARFPAIRRMAARCLFLPDYFNYLLSGRMENELSISSTSQLLGLGAAGFSPVALRRFGIPASWFSPPIKAGTRLGRVKGLPALRDVQVVAVPGHDTACAYDAMPAAPEGGDLFISSGTWSLVGFESDTPVLGPAALAARISNERWATDATGRSRISPASGCWSRPSRNLAPSRQPKELGRL
ncbi:MAG: FGGY family carbohydrate kinase [Opitutaceae bacterium]|nr:FGGY family carbohydrate kinase [Opitutaceae bacterium]